LFIVDSRMNRTVLFILIEVDLATSTFWFSVSGLHPRIGSL